MSHDIRPGQVYWSDTHCMRAVVYSVDGLGDHPTVRAVTIPGQFSGKPPRYVKWTCGVPSHYRLDKDPPR